MAFNRLLITWAFCLVTLDGYSQSKADSTHLDAVLVEAKHDSIRQVRDSLEFTLLRTTRTYAHIEQILQVIPLQSAYLDLLPSILPVDLPIDAFRVSSPFGIRRHPIQHKQRFHAGVDVKATLGMPVKATAPGFVSEVGFDQGLGAFVRIRHAFGFETTYGHLTGYCVMPGQRVGLGETLGKVGQTGLATGPHLHYVIKKNGSVIDPFQFCFLLRRRLWLYQRSMPTGSGSAISDSTN